MNAYLSEPMERDDAQALFARAGVRDAVVDIEPCRGGVTNLNYRVTLGPASASCSAGTDRATGQATQRPRRRCSTRCYATTAFRYRN